MITKIAFSKIMLDYLASRQSIKRLCEIVNHQHELEQKLRKHISLYGREAYRRENGKRYRVK